MTHDIEDRIVYLIKLVKRTVKLAAQMDNENILNGEKIRNDEQDDIVTNIVIDTIRKNVGI